MSHPMSVLAVHPAFHIHIMPPNPGQIQMMHRKMVAIEANQFAEATVQLIWWLARVVWEDIGKIPFLFLFT